MTYEGLNEILREFLKRSHPVGEIYMTEDAGFDPNVTFGGTWQKLPDGVFIRNAGGDAGTVGQKQDEGLPNLSGHFGNTDNARVSTFTDGLLFNTEYAGESDWTGTVQQYRELMKIKFDAHNYNAIYGSSQHVTPVNVAVYMWKRTD